jgi:ribosomal protein S18 acetylase RimI-like enzyme
VIARREADRIVAVEIVAAESGRAHRQFVALPYRLYRGDPRFVAPLRRERRELFSKVHHPFFAHADAAFFLARRAGRPVGRIEAIVNHSYGAAHDPHTGFFGAFECEDDRAASDALLNAAAAWLRARGMAVMRGPFTHSQNEEYALLVDGFDAPPAVQLAYNPPYYAGLLEGFGLRPAQDLHAWWADAGSEIDARLPRVAAAIRKRGRITVRPLRLADYDAEVDRAERLLNEVLEETRGFVPVTSAELRFAARQFRALLRPELVLFAEVDGDAAGIVLAMPDFNQALARVPDGRLFPFGWLRVAQGIRAIDRIRLLALGVRPAYRRRGIELLLCLELREAVRRLGYRGGELSMVWADNEAVHPTIAAMGGRRTKTYRIYEGPIPSPREAGRGLG